MVGRELRLRRRLRRRRLPAICAALALLAVFAAPAVGELVQKGNLFIRFDGGISPNALPRKERAPVAVRIDGTIRVLSGQRLPGLRGIRIALNREGKINTRGLPVCRRNRIEAATPTEALARCGRAIVGSGGLVARTSFEDQKPYLLRADLLLFNAVVRGRTAILAHLHQSFPAPITRIFYFTIRRKRGAFGTVLAATLPQSVNRNGYLKTIFLEFQRRYVYRGKRRSYITARCRAPRGFTGASFPFALASLRFDDGRKLSSKLIRSCRVRGR